MNKIIKKIFIFLTTIIILGGCGYSPVYKDLKNISFIINISEINGDREINNRIKSNLLNYMNDSISKDKVYNLGINSKYNKNIIAKDTTGAATEYKIIIEIKFKIKSLETFKEIKYIETFNMQSNSDKIEEEDYEDSIKDSLTNIISRKLILQLSQMK